MTKPSTPAVEQGPIEFESRGHVWKLHLWSRGAERAATPADLLAAGYVPASERVTMHIAFSRRKIAAAYMRTRPPDWCDWDRLSESEKVCYERFVRELETTEHGAAAESELASVRRVAEERAAELATYERAIAQFDAWLGEQAEFFKLNPQVNRTFLDVAGKLMHTLRSVRHEPHIATSPFQQEPKRHTIECGGFDPDCECNPVAIKRAATPAIQTSPFQQVEPDRCPQCGGRVVRKPVKPLTVEPGYVTTRGLVAALRKHGVDNDEHSWDECLKAIADELEGK